MTYEDYLKGVDYKNNIGLYNTVDVNERFYAGDHWKGIDHEGLPTPSLLMTRTIVQWKVAAVADRRTSMQFILEGRDLNNENQAVVEQISEYSNMLWERLKMDYLTKEGLKNAAITGDYIQYFYWDSDIKTGQKMTGDINTVLIDNVNYYPADPNNPDVQKQPYIILASREHIDNLKEEAKKYGSKVDFSGDNDNEYTSGDMGKIELDDNSKINVFLKLWKKDGKVYAEKSVIQGVIRKEWDTKLTRYPIALMNWELRKNSCHGTAEVTGIIPNQVAINKELAFSMLIQMLMSSPKIVYDATRIKKWTNAIGKAIPVNGDVREIAAVLNSSTNNFDSVALLEKTKELTMELTGTTNITLGNISNPDNTSAFIATRDAAMVPLQTIQERYYMFLEDVGQIWLDFMNAFYKGRDIPVKGTVEQDGIEIEVTNYLPFPEISDLMFRVKIDVGPSTMWSEVQQIQTMDNLLNNNRITMAEYLDRQKSGLIPRVDELKKNYSELDSLQKDAQGAQYKLQILQAQMASQQILNPMPEIPQ